MNEFAGKVALVTGGSKGIGLAAAKKLSSLGADIVLAARSESVLQGVAEGLKRQGKRCLAVKCDVTSYRDVDRAVKSTRATFGAIDILVNNAGVIDPIARLSESDPAAWGASVDVNLKGVYHGLRAVIPIMQAQGSGVIVNISSGAANSALEGWSHYCATKAAVKKLTECAHKEVGGLGVRVVGLSPGTVATDMMATIRKSGINPVSQLDWSAHIPPEWAAEAIAFLCGPNGAKYAGTDFSIKTEEGRRAVGLPLAVA